jgi:hypothetical protein
MTNAISTLVGHKIEGLLKINGLLHQFLVVRMSASTAFPAMLAVWSSSILMINQ